LEAALLLVLEAALLLVLEAALLLVLGVALLLISEAARRQDLDKRPIFGQKNKILRNVFFLIRCFFLPC
jgi:hypothetical protein